MTGGPGPQPDSFALTSNDTAFVITGAAPLSAGAGCTNTAPEVVSCPKPR